MTLDPIITSLTDIDAYKPNMGAVIDRYYGDYTARWALKVRNPDVHFTPEMINEIKKQIDWFCSLSFTKEEIDGLKTIFSDCQLQWCQYKKPKTLTLHLVNVESFETLVYPLIEYSVKDKPISWFKKFWYDGWNYAKIYDINIKQIGFKTLTKVYMRSKVSFIIDESAECLKNALDACVWNAGIKEQLLEV